MRIDIYLFVLSIRSREFGTIDTLEKIVVSGVYVVQQLLQHQLSIEIITNLSLKILPGIIVNLLF